MRASVHPMPVVYASGIHPMPVWRTPYASLAYTLCQFGRGYKNFRERSCSAGVGDAPTPSYMEVPPYGTPNYFTIFTIFAIYSLESVNNLRKT